MYHIRKWRSGEKWRLIFDVVFDMIFTAALSALLSYFCAKLIKLHIATDLSFLTIALAMWDIAMINYLFYLTRRYF